MSSMAFRSSVSEIGRRPASGQSTVYVAETGLREVAAQIIDETSRAGIPFALLDASSLFDAYTLATWSSGALEGRPSNLRDLRVLRASTVHELVHQVLPRAPVQLERYGARHLILVGVPDILCANALPARERSKLLGQIKMHLTLILRQGIDISLVCARPGSGSNLWLSSIQAAADRVFEAVVDPKSGASFRLIAERASGANVHSFPMNPQ